MRIAKLMVIAIGIIAILATSFGFRASKFSRCYIYTGDLNQPLGASACVTRVDGAALTNGTANVRASLISLTSGCLPVFTVATVD